VLHKQVQRAVKAIHIASAGAWLGALLAIAVLLVMLPHVTGRARFGIALACHWIHDVILLWAFVVTLATGLVFAAFTSWGAIKHHWIAAKWLLAIVLFGITLSLQNPALAILAGLADADAEVIGDLRYADAYRTALAVALVQLAIVAVVFAISSLKPWGQRAKDLSRRVVLVVAAIAISTGAGFGSCNHLRLEAIRDTPLDEVPLAPRADGIWHGAVDDCGILYEVEVTITETRIAKIATIRTGSNRYAQLGAAVLPRIVAAGSPSVDAITGATTTSHCLARAVARALHDAPRR